MGYVLKKRPVAATSTATTQQVYYIDTAAPQSSRTITTTHAAASTATAKTYSYTVKRGDTVSALAAVDGTTVAEIIDLNHLANANDIVVGQRLILPRPIPVGSTGTGSTGSIGSITSSPGPGGFGNGGNGIAHPETNEDL
ncbi:MAG: LysM peptidoglycan-binding domain-containing protein [Acidimicrobiales bacterium]